MGSLIYDYLAESIFFEDHRIKNNFSNTSEKDLLKELRAYRNFCIENIDNIRQEIDDVESNLKVYSGLEESPIKLLKQSAFYVEQYVLPDPLFPITHEESEMSEVMRKNYGFEESKIDRSKLTETAKYLKAITPLVVADYVKIFPVSYFFEPPKELPIHMSENYFSDILPNEILEWFHSKANVRSIDYEDGSWIINPELKIGRSIFIKFIGQAMQKGYIYHLHETGIESVNEEKNTLEFWIKDIQDSPPPDPEYFDKYNEYSFAI